MNIKETFLYDIKDHKMHILHDDGVYRHIKFNKPGTINHSFSLVTWPGHLSISGDMGDYIFKRLDDMFEFFNGIDGKLGINLGYWCQKLTAISRFGSEDGKINKFDAAGTWDNVEEYAKEICENEDIFEEFKERMESCEEDRDALALMGSYNIEEEHEYLQYEPTFHIQWALFAIAWGIMEYKKEK